MIINLFFFFNCTCKYWYDKLYYLTGSITYHKDKGVEYEKVSAKTLLLAFS